MKFLNILYTNILWDQFSAGKMPANNNTLYKILWAQEDERRARLVNPTENNYGCSRDSTLEFKVIDQHSSH
jgi:hypothetical protein